MIQFRELLACAKYYRQPALEYAVGLIPTFLSESDPRPAREQFNTAYAHGGGWRPFKGFRIIDRAFPSIQYPGDSALPPVARAQLRDEEIFIFPYAWVMILQPDGSYEISRMD